MCPRASNPSAPKGKLYSFHMGRTLASHPRTSTAEPVMRVQFFLLRFLSCHALKTKITRCPQAVSTIGLRASRATKPNQLRARRKSWGERDGGMPVGYGVSGNQEIFQLTWVIQGYPSWPSASRTNPDEHTRLNPNHFKKKKKRKKKCNIMNTVSQQTRDPPEYHREKGKVKERER